MGTLTMVAPWMSYAWLALQNERGARRARLTPVICAVTPRFAEADDPFSSVWSSGFAGPRRKRAASGALPARTVGAARLSRARQAARLSPSRYADRAFLGRDRAG